MCYNPSMSFTFFTIGVVASVIIYKYKPKLSHQYVLLIIGFYAIMELLKTIQYKYVNQCGKFMNKLLTELGYTLVIMQPLLWNVFFYLNSNSCENKLYLLAITLCICWMVVNVISRLTYSMSKNKQTEANSIIASDQVCTKIDKTHLYWVWTFANFQDFNANFLMYILLFFVPGILLAKHRTISLINIIGALTGAMLAYKFGEPKTVTTTWCYISIPIVCFMLLQMYFN